MGRVIPLRRLRRAAAPDLDLAEAVGIWLDQHAATDDLQPSDDTNGWVHRHRQTRQHPWAEIRTYRSWRDFALDHAIEAAR